MHHAGLKASKFVLYFCVWMTFEDIDGWMTTVIMEDEGEWTEIYYPNPLTQPSECNRLNTSHVCDPDGVLMTADADKLDLFAAEMRRSTPCLCSKCRMESGNGVSLGIFLRNNLTHQERSIANFTAAEMTRRIRRQWHLGPCDDDIVIVVIVEEKKSHFDMGVPVLQRISLETAEKIFNDCVVHFETGYYSQGLRSIVNSFYDILRRSPREKVDAKVPYLSKDVVIGLSAGVAFFALLICTSFFIWRHKKRKKKSKETNRSVSWEKVKTSEHFEYGSCEIDDGVSRTDSGESGSDEESSSPEGGRDEPENDPIPRAHSEQEMSISREEKAIFSSELGISDIPLLTVGRVRSQEVTEL